MNNIAIFASGNGTNAQRIVEYFKNRENIHILLILSNKKNAYVLQRAKKLNIPCFVFNKKDFYGTDKIIEKLIEYNIDFIVLAGFLLKIPKNILEVFPNKIINIHPALLPKYGGKGMYGIKVHESVIQAGERESGISIHYVNEKYDEGKVIFQAKCKVKKDDNPEILAQRVHKLEYKYYPKIIEKILLS